MIRTLVLGIFLLTSWIFFSGPCLSESYYVLMTIPLVLGILVSIALTLINSFSWQHQFFLITSLPTTLFSLLKSAGTVLSLSTSMLSTLLFKLAKSVLIPAQMYQCLLLLPDPNQLLHSQQNDYKAQENRYNTSFILIQLKY